MWEKNVIYDRLDCESKYRNALYLHISTSGLLVIRSGNLLRLHTGDKGVVPLFTIRCTPSRSFYRSYTKKFLLFDRFTDRNCLTFFIDRVKPRPFSHPSANYELDKNILHYLALTVEITQWPCEWPRTSSMKMRAFSSLPIFHIKKILWCSVMHWN